MNQTMLKRQGGDVLGCINLPVTTSVSLLSQNLVCTDSLQGLTMDKMWTTHLQHMVDGEEKSNSITLARVLLNSSEILGINNIGDQH